MEIEFKKNFNLENRINQCRTLLENNKDSIPVILYKDKNCTIDLVKSKFLVKKSTKINEFSSKVRRSLKIEKEKGLFFCVHGYMAITGDKPMEQIYNLYKDKEDGFLYILVSTELVFG